MQSMRLSPASVRLHRTLPCRKAPVGLKVQRCKASAAFSEDPYQVLGIPQGADSKRIDAAYRSKRRIAELAQDTPEMNRIEAAHSQLFMSSLNNRLSGDGPKADNDVKFADRQKLFPWRPKYWQAGNQVMGIAAAVFGAIMLYHCFLTTDPQGVVPSAMAGFALGAYKQYQIMPVTTEDRAKKMKQGWRHIIRATLMAVFATAVGVFTVVSAPDYIASAANQVLPLWFYESQNTLLTVGAALSNFLFIAFLR